MCFFGTLLHQISFMLLLLDIGSALGQSHSYVKVKVDPRLTIQWAHRGYGNEVSCSIQCIWANCPGFKWDCQTCFILESNQTLPIATRSNGTIIFIREDFIRQVESALVYNHKILYEFIPLSSPLSGFPLAFPEPLTRPKGILMDFPWGFHMCYPHEKPCYRWYFGTDEWIPMPALNVPHFGIQDMIQINQTWWILGGFRRGKLYAQKTASPHKISEYMDDAGHWHMGPQYLNRYHEGFAVLSDTSLLAVGGAHTPKKLTSSSNVVTEYDISTGIKIHRFQVTCKMFGTTCSRFESQNGTKMIFCLGGNCPQAELPMQTSVFIYNMDTGEWAEIPEWEFPEGVRFLNLAWFQGTLFVLGARYDQSDWNTIYKFDETKQPAWIVIGKLPDGESEYHYVRTINRSILVL